MIFAAILASIFVNLTPVPQGHLHCLDKKPCPSPAFKLHGYGFSDQRRWFERPIVQMSDDGHYTAHIEFQPPFAPSECEAFQMNFQPWGAMPLAKRPFKTIHDVHLELNGYAPRQDLMLGIDCWHIGKEDWTFSTIYQGIPIDAR